MTKMKHFKINLPLSCLMVECWYELNFNSIIMTNCVHIAQCTWRSYIPFSVLIFLHCYYDNALWKRNAKNFFKMKWSSMLIYYWIEWNFCWKFISIAQLQKEMHPVDFYQCSFDSWAYTQRHDFFAVDSTVGIFSGKIKLYNKKSQS